MAVAVQAGTGLLYAYKYANDNPARLSGDVQLGLQAVIPGTVTMTANDLNVLGEGANKYFTLSTNKTGLVDGDILLGRKFHAKPGANSGAVYLQTLKSDGTAEEKYAYVDTAFHVGTGTNLDTWYRFNITKTENAYIELDVNNAFDFYFKRDLFKDSVMISVPSAALKQHGAPDPSKNGSEWQATNTTLAAYTTISAIKLTPSTEVLTLFETPKEENLLFAVSSPEADETLTTVEDGVYFIKNKKGQYLAVSVYGAYDEYSGYPTWVTVNLDEQDPAHMPAYQWVALKDKTSDKAAKTSTITLTNREFAKTISWTSAGATIVDNDYATIQLRKNAGAEFMYVATYS